MGWDVFRGVLFLQGLFDVQPIEVVAGGPEYL